MQDSDKRYFVETMYGLGEVFGAILSEAMLDIYWRSLKPYGIEDFKRSVDFVVNTRKFPGLPKPADFIEFISPPEDAEIKSELALEEFFERLAESGYQSFTLRDPILAMTIQHYGGWRSIIDTYPRYDGKEAKFWLMDFKKTYRAFIGNPRNVDPRFTGSIEAENKSKGYITDETGTAVLIEFEYEDAEGNKKQDRRPLLAATDEGQRHIEARNQKQLPEPERA